MHLTNPPQTQQFPIGEVDQGLNQGTVGGVAGWVRNLSSQYTHKIT